MWKVSILTLFPEIFPGPLDISVTGNALKNGLCSIEAYNIRDYTKDKHKTVDDTPYGGGSGMVMRADVLGDAIEKCFIPNGRPIIYLSPRGKVFNQKVAKQFIDSDGINIICGRFEGIDERIIEEYNIQEISLGDFVLSSGDVAAIPMLDCCIRMLPGVLEEGEALQEESFGLDPRYQDLLEYPHYTRPAEWKGREVPGVLSSGNHKEIANWRLKQAEEKTKAVRSDLWTKYKSD